MAKFKINTEFAIEREDKEILLDVEAMYYLQTKSYFNGMTGEGHPGDPAEIEILSVKYQNKEFELTDEETEKLKEKINDEECEYEDDCPEWDEEKDW